ncbi:hypothetical protein FM105_01865 [Brevibacterium yomogidense]|uniref:Uncharacterized protein n=1 Tax=Brevibacterium yomogidense TaxID=946573 RepID=A0A1X6WWW5_9MICO|nr:hypothetical protein FM105_01865 [Brevibacterium yomogidense]
MRAQFTLSGCRTTCSSPEDETSVDEIGTSWEEWGRQE